VTRSGQTCCAKHKLPVVSCFHSVQWRGRTHFPCFDRHIAEWISIQFDIEISQYICLNQRNSKQLSPYRETISRSAIQEFPKILWNPKIHYSVHSSPPLIPTLGQINPVPKTASCFSTFCLNIILRCTYWSYVPSPTKELYVFFIRATCPANLIFLDLIILILLGEEGKLWSSSLYSFLYNNLRESTNILLGITYWNVVKNLLKI
jgi:hypothetical protein